MKIRSLFKVLFTGFALSCFFFSPCPAQDKTASENPPQSKEVFQDDPAARALYEKMIDAMRSADSLYWEGEGYREVRGHTYGNCTYKMWLKKPNYARVEATRAGSDKITGILVGDGEYFWTYWPNGKLRYGWEYSGKYGEEYEKYKDIFYMKKRSPVGAHSLGHEVDELGMTGAIIDPSTFHGYTDSLQPYLDGACFIGDETIGGEECTGIEVSFMKHQRSWYIWLSKRDHLPRKVKQIVRVQYDIIRYESFSNLKINPEIPLEKFSWKPGEGWKEWRMPSIEEGLLKPGTEAPDFELTLEDGNKLRLSSLRGKVVCLNKWRCG